MRSLRFISLFHQMCHHRQLQLVHRPRMPLMQHLLPAHRIHSSCASTNAVFRDAIMSAFKLMITGIIFAGSTDHNHQCLRPKNGRLWMRDALDSDRGRTCLDSMQSRPMNGIHAQAEHQMPFVSMPYVRLGFLPHQRLAEKQCFRPRGFHD